MENVLQINKDHRIGADADQFILYRRRVGNKGKSRGKETWIVMGYYTSIESIMRDLGTQSLMENLGDLKKALQEIKDLRDWCRKNLIVDASARQGDTISFQTT